MTLDGVADVVAAVLLLCGAVLALGAGVGLVRFPDLLARMHTAAKPQVLGLLLMLGAVALRVRDGSVVGMLALVALLQLMTAPVAAHMVARAGYRTGKVDSERLVVDELTRDLLLATEAQPDDGGAGEARDDGGEARDDGAAPGGQPAPGVRSAPEERRD